MPKEAIKADEEIRTYSDAIEKATCPKYNYSHNIFKLWDDATWYSDGEDVKHFNIKCLGTESSPCSFCSDKSVKTPEKKKPEFAQAKGFNKDDFEGEEETPEKIPPNACKWCLRIPVLWMMKKQLKRDVLLLIT